MILDQELELPAAIEPSSQRQSYKHVRSPFSFRASLCLLFLAVVVFLQVLSGAYGSEFSAYPDEPAHYVTSLMLRDYVAHFHLNSPLQFAEAYYSHYPKVAFGHWPPFFYIVQALWMSLFSASRISIRLEVACTTALLAYAVFVEARKWFGEKPAIACGLLTVCLPLVQTYSAEEMSEMLLTLVCFWSTVYFARFVSSGRMRDSLLFGVFFSLAVLTKGNGWLLAIVPPITLLLTRRVSLLWRWSFWLPVGLIAALCLPWQLMTMRMAERGWEGGSKPTVAYTVHALLEFLGLFPQILGPILLSLMVVGVGVLIVAAYPKHVIQPRSAAMLALIIGVWTFHSIVPAGVEDRKLIIAIPAMVLFLFAGALWLADQLPKKTVFYQWRVAGTLGVVAVSFFAATFQVPRVEHYGYTEAVKFLAKQGSVSGSTILVSSSSGGEGLLISEMAMNAPHPVDTIIRATKSLANVDWNGAGYRCIYTDSSQVMRFLGDEKVRFVVVDTFAPQVNFAHDQLLKRTLDHSNLVSLIKTIPSRTPSLPGEIRIYRVRS